MLNPSPERSNACVDEGTVQFAYAYQISFEAQDRRNAFSTMAGSC
jgi:hypothetical protein